MIFRSYYYGAVVALMCGMSLEMLHAAHETPQSYLDSLNEEAGGARGGAGCGPLAGRKRKSAQVSDSCEAALWYPVIVPLMRESNESGVGLGKHQLHVCAQKLTRIIFDAADAVSFDCELMIAGFKQNLFYVQELINLPPSCVSQRTLASLICLNNQLCLFYARLTPKDFEAIFHPLSTYGRARHQLFVEIVKSIQSFITYIFSFSYHALDMELAPLKCPYNKGFASYAAVAEAAGAASLPVRTSEESIGILTGTHSELPASFNWSGNTYLLVPGELSGVTSHGESRAVHGHAAAAPASPAGRFHHAGAFVSPPTVVASPYDALGSPASGSAHAAPAADDLHALARISPSSPTCCAAAVAAAAATVPRAPTVGACDASAGMSTPMGRAPAVLLQRAPARMTPCTRAAQRAARGIDERSISGPKEDDGASTPINQGTRLPSPWAPRKVNSSPLIPLTLHAVPPVPAPGGAGRALSVVLRPAPVFRVLYLDSTGDSVLTVGGEAADGDGIQRAPAQGVARHVVLPPEVDDALPESDDEGTSSDGDSD